MATYNHGVRVLEQPTSVTAPINGTAGLQVVFGTAPINLADDPYSVTNKPIIAYTWSEAVSQLGYSDDYENYTLCQSMYASFKLFNVAPVIFVNVLDPKTHTKDNSAADVDVVNMEAVVKTTGILPKSVVVKEQGSEGSTYQVGTDYVLSFDDNGYLVITLLASGSAAGQSKVNVASTSIDPSRIEATDIVGTSSGGEEKGLEVIRQIYPRFGLTPGLIIAPGWSQDPDVGVVLAAKCEEINGYFTCEGFVDIDSSAGKCTKYTDVKNAKEEAGISSPHIMALWPCFQVGTQTFWASAIMAAVTAYTDANNDDVPYLSPSNKLLGITGTVLADGTEVLLDQVQANTVNSFGVTTAINNNGWRSWGNNSAAYPSTTDPKDRWFCCRRYFSWRGNSFILTYAEKVDDPANPRLIEDIVDSENIRGNSYVSAGKCAADYIEFNETENTVTDLMNGQLKFHQHLAPWTPAEDIVNTLEFDPAALQSALGGGE